MGRVQQLKREGKISSPGAAVDNNGDETTNPEEVAALKPLCDKGYGLSLINELVAVFIGASKPTLRSRHLDDEDKHTPNFYFQVIHPEALSSGAFAKGRNQSENIKVVLDDILGEGNENCIIPGQIEAKFAALTEKSGRVTFFPKILEFNQIADVRAEPWQMSDFQPNK